MSAKLVEDDDVVAVSKHAREALASTFSRCTILVLGKAGVGKSTLLNAVFGQELAETGIGRGVTKHLRAYQLSGVPVTIIDSRGIEIGDELQDFLDEVLAEVNHRATGPEDDRVHVVWFCTSSGGARLLGPEEQLVRDLSEGPDAVAASVIVPTKFAGFDEDEQYLEWLRAQELPGPVIPVLAKPMHSPAGTFPASGLEELVNATEQVLSAGRALAFENAQRVRLAKKITDAQALVNQYAADVPVRTSLVDLAAGVDLKPAAAEAGRRIARMVGEIAAVFGSTSVPDSALVAILSEMLGGTRFSDIADTLATALGAVAGGLGSSGGPVAGRIGQVLGRLAAGRFVGGAAKVIDAFVLQSSERKLTRAAGEAAIETFEEASEHGAGDEEMTGQQIGAFFERAFERAMKRQ